MCKYIQIYTILQYKIFNLIIPGEPYLLISFSLSSRHTYHLSFANNAIYAKKQQFMTLTTCLNFCYARHESSTIGPRKRNATPSSSACLFDCSTNYRLGKCVTFCAHQQQLNICSCFCADRERNTEERCCWKVRRRIGVFGGKYPADEPDHQCWAEKAFIATFHTSPFQWDLHSIRVISSRHGSFAFRFKRIIIRQGKGGRGKRGLLLHSNEYSC